MKVKVAQSCLTLRVREILQNSRVGQNTGVGSLSLLQRLFPTQESNQGLLHCWRILYQLSYQGSPQTLMLEPNSATSWQGNFPCHVTRTQLL